jgi:phage FluMu protein Com
MARRQVLEIRCDRCKKVETQEIKPEEEKPEIELTVSFGGKSVEYEDLCNRCRSSIDRYFKQMTLQNEKTEEPPKEESKSRFLGGRRAAG